MLVVLLIAHLSFVIFNPTFLFADDAVSGVKKYGIVHDVADDREFEKVGGIYQAEGLDKYVKKHFDDLSARLTEIDNKITAMQKKLDDVLIEFRESRNK